MEESIGGEEKEAVLQGELDGAEQAPAAAIEVGSTQGVCEALEGEQEGDGFVQVVGVDEEEDSEEDVS